MTSDYIKLGAAFLVLSFLALVAGFIVSSPDESFRQKPEGEWVVPPGYDQETTTVLLDMHQHQPTLKGSQQ